MSDDELEKRYGLPRSTEYYKFREKPSAKAFRPNPITISKARKSLAAIMELSLVHWAGSARRAGGMSVRHADFGGATMPPGQNNIFMSVYLSIREYRDSGGNTICESFTKLPSKRVHAAYYERTKHPISLIRIRNKIEKGFYRTLDELHADLDRMFDNAVMYYPKTDRMVKDALELKTFVAGKITSMKQFENQVPPAVLPMSPTTPNSPRRAGSPRGGSTSGSGGIKRIGFHEWTERDYVKKRMITIYRVLERAKDGERELIGPFEHLPSSAVYPDYYEVIHDPICMAQIKSNIQQGKYMDPQETIDDLRRMLSNAKTYNEPGSQIYNDADYLERTLDELLKRLRPLDEVITQGSARRDERHVGPPGTPTVVQQVREIFKTVFEYKDSTGRVLSEPFFKLPTKQEMPQYYDVIKNPLDLSRIKSRIRNMAYNNFESFMVNMNTVFDNACRFNEPDSLIYKDALTLQRLCIQKRANLAEQYEERTDEAPDVRAELQQLLLTLFVDTYNAQDSEGRTYTDNMVDVLYPNETATERRAPLTFDTVRTNLDKKSYARLDRFQMDMFSIFNYVRSVAKSTEAQLYKDVVELQRVYIKLRNELCADGDRLSSPALDFGDDDLEQLLEEEREHRAKEGDSEQSHDDTCPMDEDDDQNTSLNDDVQTEAKFGDSVYRRHDYVYVDSGDPSVEKYIYLIEKFLTNDKDQRVFKGVYFCRPTETFHVASRKFYPQEIFHTPTRDEIPLSAISGRCHVMPYTKFFTIRPKDIPDADVFVCEMRYFSKARQIKPLKNTMMRVPQADHIVIIEREEPLEPVRVASQWASKSTGDEASGAQPNKLLAMPVENVVLTKREKERSAGGGAESESEKPQSSEEKSDQIYYEQYCLDSRHFKLGDCVYVRSEEEKPFIARVDKIWRDSETGHAHFSGPWFVRPSEIEHLPTRMFYRNELFLSSITDSNPLASIIARCAVMSPADYCSGRNVEILEADNYVCDSKYFEMEKSIRKLNKGLRRFPLTTVSLADEIYTFKRPIPLEKEPSPLLPAESLAHDPPLVSQQPVTAPQHQNQHSQMMPPQQQQVMMPQQQYRAPLMINGQPGYAPYSQQPIQGQPMQPQQLNMQRGPVPSQYPGATPYAMSGQMYPSQQYSMQQQQAGHQYPPQQAHSQQPSFQMQQPMPQMGQMQPHPQQQMHPGMHAGQIQPRSQVPYGTDQQQMYPGYQQPMQSQVAQQPENVKAVMTPRAVDPPQPPRSHKKRKRGTGNVSAYILYAGEVRRAIQEEFPEKSFGEISRIVGERWKQTDADTKADFEKKAKIKMEEIRASNAASAVEEEMADDTASRSDSPSSQRSMTPRVPPQTPSSSAPGMRPQGYPQMPLHAMPGQISNMPPQYPGAMARAPTPQMLQQAAPGQPPQQMGLMRPGIPQAQVFPGASAPPGHAQPLAPPHHAMQQAVPGAQLPQPQQQSGLQPHSSSGPVQQASEAVAPSSPPPAPMFIMPPKYTKAQHSEVYLKYVESLRTGSNYLGNVDVQLCARAEHVRVTPGSKLPNHWFQDGIGKHDNVVSALWALRDTMLKDALSIERKLELDEL